MGHARGRHLLPRARLAILVLASASPQRAAILDQLGIPFTARAAGVDELSDGAPRDVVCENALRKARAVDGDPVLGSDTVVALDGDVLGKPAGEGQARDFLERLSGREHQVWSSAALIENGEVRVDAAASTVRFRALTPADVDWYLATGEWRGRAGGYAIQGRGAALVDGIDGDYNCVVGLPVAVLLTMAPDLIHP